jgi:hypothetical protein
MEEVRVKNFLMLMAIVWFVLGASAAHDRGYFNTQDDRTCAFVGSAALTVVAGPVNYAGLKPQAHC